MSMCSTKVLQFYRCIADAVVSALKKNVLRGRKSGPHVHVSGEALAAQNFAALSLRSTARKGRLAMRWSTFATSRAVRCAGADG